MAAIALSHSLAQGVFATFVRAVVSTHFLGKGDYTIEEIVQEAAQRASQTNEAISMLASQVIDAFTQLATTSPSSSPSLSDYVHCDSASTSTLQSIWTELGPSLRRSVTAQRQWTPAARSCAWTVDVKMLGRRTEMLNEPECTVRLVTAENTLQFCMDKSSLSSLVHQLESIDAQVKSLVFKSSS